MIMKSHFDYAAPCHRRRAPACARSLPSPPATEVNGTGWWSSAFSPIGSPESQSLTRTHRGVDWAVCQGMAAGLASRQGAVVGREVGVGGLRRVGEVPAH
jgi:hypothetical protein